MTSFSSTSNIFHCFIEKLPIILTAEMSSKIFLWQVVTNVVSLMLKTLVKRTVYWLRYNLQKKSFIVKSYE